MRERETFLGRIEDGLSRMSGWLAARQRGGEQAGASYAQARLHALRGEIAQARHGIAVTAREDLARARAALDDMRRDYDVPPLHTALSRAELEAFRRHLHTTARLLRERATADSPDWTQATEEYERSWAELERAFESERDAPSP